MVLSFMTNMIKIKDDTNRVENLKFRVKRKYEDVVLDIKHIIFSSKRGKLSWDVIIRIALTNLLSAPSRTGVTVGAIAIGTAAVVFLMSFSYGLEKIVTNRLVQPNSMRLADVQSQSTALSLNKKTAAEIEKLPGVEKIAKAVSLAGSMSVRNSKMDVVIMGVANDYLNFGNFIPVAGKMFSSEAEKQVRESSSLIDLVALLQKNTAILGISDSAKPIFSGQFITDKTVRFRVEDEIYLPVRSGPSADDEITGYVRGNIMDSYSGKEVWGGVYQSENVAGKNYLDQKGNWWGRWMQAHVPLWSEEAPTVYVMKKDTDGNQLFVEGYIAERNVKIMSDNEALMDKQLQELQNKKPSVLGLSTDTNLVSQSIDKSSTAAAELTQLVQAQQTQKASISAQLAIIEVKKQGGKEILVSTNLLSVLKIKVADIINTKVDLSYIVSGDLLSGVAGRVVSKPVTYTVVGVIKDDKRPFVFAPLADIESIGIQKYSIIKVLAKDPQTLPAVRSKIQIMGFMTQSIVDTLSQVNKLFGVMRFLLGTFGMIAFVVAIFGMFNTLTISLLERTREVGVMKTIGTTDDDVMRLFLVESVIVGVCGGITGIALGIMGGRFIDSIFVFFQVDKSVRLFYAPPLFLFGIFCMSVLIGFATGIYPSRRAKQISPLNALRYE